MAPEKGRGFWSSFQYATLLGGQLLALLVSLLLQLIIGQDAIRSGGWRIAFIVGAALAVGVFVIRRSLAETRVFEAMAGSDGVVEESRSSLTRLWRDHKRSVILVALMSGGGGMASYSFTTYMLKFLQGTAKFDEWTATLIMMGVLLWSVLMQPVWGAISVPFCGCLTEPDRGRLAAASNIGPCNGPRHWVYVSDMRTHVLLLLLFGDELTVICGWAVGAYKLVDEKASRLAHVVFQLPHIVERSCVQDLQRVCLGERHELEARTEEVVQLAESGGAGGGRNGAIVPHEHEVLSFDTHDEGHPRVAKRERL
jgi:MFS family permease